MFFRELSSCSLALTLCFARTSRMTLQKAVIPSVSLPLQCNRRWRVPSCHSLCPSHSGLPARRDLQPFSILPSCTGDRLPSSSAPISTESRGKEWNALQGNKQVFIPLPHHPPPLCLCLSSLAADPVSTTSGAYRSLCIPAPPGPCLLLSIPLETQHRLHLPQYPSFMK